MSPSKKTSLWRSFPFDMFNASFGLILFIIILWEAKGTCQPNKKDNNMTFSSKSNLVIQSLWKRLKRQHDYNLKEESIVETNIELSSFRQTSFAEC